MKAYLNHFYRFLISMVVIAMVLMLIGTPQSAAQGPTTECAVGGEITSDCQPADDSVNAQSGAFFKKGYSTTQKGGYVAHGVGMRNTGYGIINVSDVPAGSTVSKAFLFWALMAPASMSGYSYNKGYLNGAAITGSLIGAGQNPCWGSYPIMSYRADVTGKVLKAGNGVYHLWGFASGLTDGTDPWTGSAYPMLEGASLVILYKNTSYPTTTFQIYNGATTSYGGEIHLNMPGINAVGLTGFAYTTFIGADGQSSNETGSKFFSNALPSVGWDGSDPNGAGFNYSLGNLWDTMTVDVHSMIDPPEPDFWFTTQGSPDCLTWVAQVVAYSNGNQDTDGDRLKDGWELNGYNYTDLPGMGANPLHKDLFVEADYMPNTVLPTNTLPDKAQLDDIVAVFNNAPVSNPDGTTGIHIHIDTGGAANGSSAGTWPAYNFGGGNSIPYQEHLGANTPGCAYYDWSQFQALKDANFSSYYRGPIFHYMIFAHDLAPCFMSTSGISRNGSTDALFIKGATDFIVSMGSWPSQGTSLQREGTFIHEFGHNLGLRHGGNDHNNYKPNYLSVMNYFFQTMGVYRDGSWYNFDYSRFTLPSLNEKALNEVTGLGPLASSYGTRWFCGNYSYVDYTAGSYVDWNCDGIYSTSVKADINGDGYFSTLGTQNNWANITFQGGGVIGSGVSAAGLGESLGITNWVNELTYEQAQIIEAAK
jgi:hypothetical protein